MNKAALAGTFVMAGVMAAQAITYNGDLLVGFTVQNGNDLVYDLGSEASLVNGSSWNLASALSAAGISLSSSALQWGVVGSKGTAGPEWLTDVSIPAGINHGEATSINQTVAALVINDFTAVGAGNYATPANTLSYSWNQETAQGASASGSAYSSEYTDPNLAGVGTITFYNSTDTGAVTSPGTFTLTSNGVLTFNLATSAPPAPRIVSVTRSGSNSTIYFTTANGFTYTLYYTNSAGLLTSVANWPKLSATVMGNGLTNSLSDTTSVADRFYAISAH